MARRSWLKRPEDWDAWAWVYEQHHYGADEAALAQCGHCLEVLGEDGVLYVVGPATPIMDAVRSWAGIENVVYGLCDFPERVEHLLTVAAERCCEQYEVICAHTPATLVVLWDDATTSLLSRALFERFSVPVLRRYAEIAHRHGKLLVNHTCGKIRGFADLYATAQQDALDWLAVPATGDMSLSLAQQMWQGQVTPMVTPDPSTVRHGAPEEVAAHLEGILQGADLTNAVVLLPCPQGTPPATARAMVQVPGAARRTGERGLLGLGSEATMNLTEQTVRTYTELLAGPGPTPGGGSAAGLAGALAAASAAMVGSFTRRQAQVRRGRSRSRGAAGAAPVAARAPA